jgi:hypothetical protein
MEKCDDLTMHQFQFLMLIDCYLSELFDVNLADLCRYKLKIFLIVTT